MKNPVCPVLSNFHSLIKLFVFVFGVVVVCSLLDEFCNIYLSGDTNVYFVLFELY